MLEVLHVIPLLWSGAGRVLTRLCALQSRTLRVGMVTATRSGVEQDWPAYRRALSRAGVRQTRIDFFARNAETFWTGTRSLAALIDRERPAVVHTHAGVPAAAAAVARTLSARPFRIVAHFYSWGLNRPDWMNEMDLWGFRRADRVLCSAEAYKRLLVSGGVEPQRIMMVPWGVETTPERSRVTIPGRPLTLGFVGRIEPRKRQLQLVRVAAELRRWWPDVHLDLVGPSADSSYDAAIREAIAASGMEGRVRLLGKVKHPADHIVHWDLFVSLSCDEGQGMAILEAMEMGIPVAASVVAGVEDFVSRGRHAFPLPARLTTGQVARHLRVILADRQRMADAGRRGRAFVHRHYEWAQTLKRVLLAYRLSVPARVSARRQS